METGININSIISLGGGCDAMFVESLLGLRVKGPVDNCGSLTGFNGVIEVLDKTLQYLTYLSIFSYEILADGNIVNIAGDTRLIDKARTNNVAPMMVITNIENNATFSS